MSISREIPLKYPGTREPPKRAARHEDFSLLLVCHGTRRSPMESIAPAATPTSVAEARPAALPWHVSAALSRLAQPVLRRGHLQPRGGDAAARCVRGLRVAGGLRRGDLRGAGHPGGGARLPEARGAGRSRRGPGGAAADLHGRPGRRAPGPGFVWHHVVKDGQGRARAVLQIWGDQNESFRDYQAVAEAAEKAGKKAGT